MRYLIKFVNNKTRETAQKSIFPPFLPHFHPKTASKPQKALTFMINVDIFIFVKDAR